MKFVPAIEKFEFVVDHINVDPNIIRDMLIKMTFESKLEGEGGRLNSPTPELKSHYKLIASGDAMDNGVSTVCAVKMTKDVPVPFSKEGIMGSVDANNFMVLFVGIGELKVPTTDSDTDEYLKITIVPDSNKGVVRNTYLSASSKKTLELMNAGRKRVGLPPLKPGDTR